MTAEAVVSILGSIPPARVREFLQHIRSFDHAHAGCHFKIQIASPTAESANEIVQMLAGLDPPIPPILVVSLERP